MSRTSYEQRPFSAPDQGPLQRPDLDDLTTTTGKQPPQLNPVCWKCGLALSACKCRGVE
jgi:hypothetical protein